ncbi:MAG TPA: cyclase family protein [Vicinamibacterales bacterium]|nr:cyclase family protein [Vicinamibacterales bacterium]
MMRIIAGGVTIGAVTIAMACAAPGPASSAFPAGVLVDLSHSYDGSTLYWPTSDTFRLEKVSEGMTPGGYYYAANNLFTAEHGGTHIDAPIHFAAGRATVDQLPLERLAGPAVVVDVSDRAEANRDYQVTTDDLLQWESVHGSIPPEAILLLRTGFSRRWPDAIRYLGTDERGSEAVAKLHFPGLHPDAARWLTVSRPVRAVGIDTASIDFGQSTGFEAHRVLFERDIPAFENLTALERLPPVGAFVIALPMKIGGGSGAPLRAVAVVPESR